MTTTRGLRLLGAAAAITALAIPITALGDEQPGDAGRDEESEFVAPDSPRAAVTSFLEAAGRCDWESAGRFLEVPRRMTESRSELARRLKAVLDRRLWIDLEALSPMPKGREDDQLPPGTDEVGSIPDSTGNPIPVRLVRRLRSDAAVWMFSRATVTEITAWYGDLEDGWIRDYMPESLLRQGPLGLSYWQWIAVPTLALLSFAFGWLLGWLSARLLRRLALRARRDAAVMTGIVGPFALAWALILIHVGLPFLGLPVPAQRFGDRLLTAGFYVVFFWATYRAVGVLRDAATSSEWAKSRPGTAAVLPLTFKALKVLVVAIAAILVVAAMGYPVASLLAGLGIGGLALALAAQKTVENLFGSVSIGVDQPMRVDDFVKVDDTVGTVESIGLRSTRIRTLDRTLVTIPNGKLADMRIESYAARDRIRLSCMVALEYGTTAAQVRKVVAGIEASLRAHPKIWPDTIVVRLAKLGDWSLDVEVMAWFRTTDWDEFAAIRQDLLLSFLEIVQECGAKLAFPTRTVRVEGGKASQGIPENS